MKIRHISIDKLKAMCPNKRIIITVCAVLTCFMLVGGSIAWLTSISNDVKNEFTPGEVTITIVEEFEDDVKSNVRIGNTGNVDAYIRVALVPAWVDENGNVVAQQASLDDCTITWGEGVFDSENPVWFKGSDGYYYCTTPIPPPKSEERDDLGNLTPILIKDCKVKDPVNGIPHQYDFELRVIASAVQAIPTDAVKEAWGVGVDNSGNLIPAPPEEKQGGN